MTMSAGFWQALKKGLTSIASDIYPLRSEIDDSDETARFFLYWLMSASESASGCVLLGKAHLGVPLGVVARSLFEAVISTYWASLSDENAKYAKESEMADMLRIMKLNLEKGRAQIVHKETGKIETDALLKHPLMKEARSSKRLADMATEAGMRNVYDQLYGLLSMRAHGSAVQMIAALQLEGKPPVYEDVSLVRGCLKCIHVIAVNRIREKKQTPRSDLESILGVNFSA
jgi:hypothetical protein